MTDGRYTKVDIFEAKYLSEEYIRALPVSSAFISPCSFMQNYHTMFGPKPVGNGTYVMRNIFNPDTEYPLIDAADVGKWVPAVLASSEEYNHKTFSVAERIYTQQEIVDTVAKATGKKVVYQQLPDDEFKKFLRPGTQESSLQMLQYCRDYGYFGRDQKELVEWTTKQANGRLTSLEEFLKKQPLKLE